MRGKAISHHAIRDRPVHFAARARVQDDDVDRTGEPPSEKQPSHGRRTATSGGWPEFTAPTRALAIPFWDTGGSRKPLAVDRVPVSAGHLQHGARRQRCGQETRQVRATSRYDDIVLVVV